MAILKIGLTLANAKTIEAYDQTISLGFYRPHRIIEADADTYVLKVRFKAYKSKAYFLANGKNSHYDPASVILEWKLDAQTWPFLPGVDPWPAIWDLIAQKSEVERDGEEVNGGIDWSAATVETITIP